MVFIRTPDLKAVGNSFSISNPGTNSPVKFSVKGKQLFIQTSTMTATCDQVTEMPTGPGHVMMEGNVKMTFHAPQAQTRIESSRVIVDLKSSIVSIVTENGPVRPTQHIGLWYAPSPMPMTYPPAPPVPPMPFGMPMPTPVSRPVSPAVYHPIPSTSPR
jgi:hypothetical protein